MMSVFVIATYRLRDFIYLHVQALTKIRISNTLMQRMLQHSLLLFHNNLAGNLANKIKDVMSGFADSVKSIDELFAICLSLVIAIFTLGTINYQFALLFVVWLIIFASICALYSIKGSALCVAGAEMNSILLGQLVDTLNNIVSVKLFSSGKQELRQIDATVNTKVAADKRRDWHFLCFFMLLGITFVVYQIIAFVLLIYWFKKGVVTVGDFAMLVGINISIVGELWTLSGRFVGLAEILGSVAQGLRVALQPIDILDKRGAAELRVSKGNIEFARVTFNYPDVEPIFTAKSVHIKSGQKVGLVGYSGGGKTTFVNLILRLYDISAGKILIDGQNIQDVTQDSLHQNISMIPQDPILFHRNILENIRYGRANASDAEVLQAANMANAYDFIMQLPQQYYSIVGDRGVKLSGGQRQRIAIARAILKDAPILILDEATSQLDSLTEKEIQACIKDLMHNRTTLVIAHRLATLLHMDRILVFSHGKIVEDGSHAELLAQNGLYKRLWDAQVGGFLLDRPV